MKLKMKYEISLHYINVMIDITGNTAYFRFYDSIDNRTC